MSVNIARIVRPLSILLAVFFLALVSAPASAHEPEEESEVGDFVVEVTPREIIQGDSIPLEAHISKGGESVAGLAVTLTVDRHEENISDRLDTVEREPGHYVATYEFRMNGDYEVHVEFLANGKEVRITRPLLVLPAASFVNPGYLFGGGALLAAIVILAAGAVKKKIKPAILGSLAVIGASWLGYSLFITKSTNAPSLGIITCPSENQCFLTAHIHAYVPVTICGEPLRLPIETGNLQRPHTHEEVNVIHWHDRLPYDKAAEKLIEETPLTLGAFFDEIGIPFDNDRIGDGNTVYQNRMSCPNGKPGTLKMFVNGAPNQEFRAYRWNDKDVIVIIFDETTSDAAEQRLRTNPIEFPALGRG